MSSKGFQNQQIYISNTNQSDISPAHLNAYFAINTAIISLIIAAATIVPDITDADEGSILFNVVTAIHVKTRETPE